MPVGQDGGGERPHKAVPGQSGFDLGVCRYEDGIVVGDKVVGRDWPIDGQGGCEQNGTDDVRPPGRWNTRVDCFGPIHANVSTALVAFNLPKVNEEKGNANLR